MNLRDLIGGLFWLAISLSVCGIVSVQVSIGTLKSPGPGFFPFWSGIALGTLAVIRVIKSILEKKVNRGMIYLWKGVEWTKVILVVVSLFAYVILLPRLGYLIDTFVVLTFLFSMKRRSRLWIHVMTAFITVLVSYVVFRLWLQVPLPKGIIDF